MQVLFGRPVLLMVLFTLLFAPGIIPMFLLVKQPGLLDSLCSLILPGALGAFNFVVQRLAPSLSTVGPVGFKNLCPGSSSDG